MSLHLSEAQAARRDRGEIALDQAIDGVLDKLYAAMGEQFAAENASPTDRQKLKGLIKFYMKKAHPFGACVRDNTKRFGKKGAERVCATLKDIGKGTTKWRNGGGKTNASLQPVPLVTVIDDELATELERFARLDIASVLGLDDTEEK